MDGYDHVTGVLALPSSIEHEILEAEKSVHPLVIHRKITGNDWTRVLIFVNEKFVSLLLQHIDRFQIFRIPSRCLTIGSVRRQVQSGESDRRSIR